MENNIQNKFVCECGKVFETQIKLSHHKTHCKIFQEVKNKILLLKKKKRIEKIKQFLLKKQNLLKEIESRRLPNGMFKCENPNCNKEHDGNYGSGRFCSANCARTFSAYKANPKNISSGVRKWNSLHHIYKIKEFEKRFCKWCKKEFTIDKKSKRGCCCNSHSQKYHSALKYAKLIELAESEYSKIQLQLKLYRLQCAFKFALSDYPDEFDFSLIEKYGWYSAKNRGNNLNGVSRDHMYSVNDGFLNKVDPNIISHPANCKLMQHSINAKKRNRSSITLDELKERIKRWDLKYNLVSKSQLL